MAVRRIKFALEMTDKKQVRSLEELREYFDLESIIGYLQDGKLLTWLTDRCYDEEADKIRKLKGNEHDIGEQLCRIFQVEGLVDSRIHEPPETIAWRAERLGRLKQYAADEEILSMIDFVAFNQDDLEEILHEDDTNIVYLCQNKFSLPSWMLRKENMKYIGLGKGVVVTVSGVSADDISKKNIEFDNVEISGILKCGKSESVQGEKWYRNIEFLSEFSQLMFMVVRTAIVDRVAYINAGFSMSDEADDVFVYEMGRCIDNLDKAEDYVSVLVWQKGIRIQRFWFSRESIFYMDVTEMLSPRVVNIKYDKIDKVWSDNEYVCIDAMGGVEDIGLSAFGEVIVPRELGYF